MKKPRTSDITEVLKKTIETTNLALGMLESLDLFETESAACKICGERTIKAYTRIRGKILPGWYCRECKIFQRSPYLPDFPWKGDVDDTRLLGAGFFYYVTPEQPEKKEEEV
jgi:hypothetical protein